MRPDRRAHNSSAGLGQDPHELVRRSIAQNQLDWVRMKDYTWQAHSVEKHLDSHGRVVSTKWETWETLMLDGQPYRRTLERDGKSLSPEEQRTEHKKLDRETRRPFAISHQSASESSYRGEVMPPSEFWLSGRRGLVPLVQPLKFQRFGTVG
jgi:hypothetical protein